MIETSEASHRKSMSSPQPAASTSKGGSPRKDENTSGMYFFFCIYFVEFLKINETNYI